MSSLILHKTPNYLIVSKPAGLITHCDAQHTDDSLATRITREFPETNEVGDQPTLRPGIVHRIDKNVSGVLVVARTQEFFEHIKKQFMTRKVQKTYLALVHGKVSKDEGQITTPIGRASHGRRVARTQEKDDNKQAKTKYEVQKRFSHYTYLQVEPLTGRTHQIRVHLNSIGHPIVGDPVYISKKYRVHEKNMRKKFPTLEQRIWLHAHSIRFQDLANEEQSFTLEPPDDIMQIINYLNLRNKT